jgi:hypothetical protein
MADKLQSDVGGLAKLKPLGDGSYAIAVAPVDSSGNPFGGKTAYTLLTGSTVTGAGVGPIAGGDYLWRAECAGWNGATATLEFLGLDGTTWYPVKKSDGTTSVTLTANGSVACGVAQGAMLRVAISAAVPTQPMYSAMGGL